jgi:hypothetical protein
MLFIVDNQNLYLSSVSLSCVQSAVSYSGVKIFNGLPSNIQSYKMTGRFKTSYTDSLLFIPFIELPNLQNAR